MVAGVVSLNPLPADNSERPFAAKSRAPHAERDGRNKNRPALAGKRQSA